jgi:hypothetical protein
VSTLSCAEAWRGPDGWALECSDGSAYRWLDTLGAVAHLAATLGLTVVDVDCDGDEEDGPPRYALLFPAGAVYEWYY